MTLFILAYLKWELFKEKHLPTTTTSYYFLDFGAEKHKGQRLFFVLDCRVA